MFARYGFSGWTIYGAPDLEAGYATVLVVLATTVMICYVALMTPHDYRLIYPWTSLFRTRRSPQEPLQEKNVAVDPLASTCNEGHALADNNNGTLPSIDVADPIVEPEVPLAEGEPQVLEDLPRPQPSSISVQSEVQVVLEVDVSESEEPQAEEPRMALQDVDSTIAHLPFGLGSETESGAALPGTVTVPPVVDIQEIVDASPRCASDGSDETRPKVEAVESLVAAPESPAQTQPPADAEASMLIEEPFLLTVESGSSVRDGERSSEDDAAAASLTCGGLAESPTSDPGCTHGSDAPSFLMQSALLVPAEPVTSEDPSPSENGAELEVEDDWTSIDPGEPTTPRPSSPVVPQLRMEDPTKEIQAKENDLTVSAVLLTQSQYASAIQPPISAADDSASSPTSSSSSSSMRSRVHTSDQPDWAVAPQDKEDEMARQERTLRRHSVDSPDWAVAPEVVEDRTSFAKKKGRRGDPGSGTRRKSRRAWTSR